MEREALKDILKAFDIDGIYGVDYETFWDKGYTLRSMATTDYIYDDRFELQLAAVRKDSWSKSRVMEGPKFVEWAKSVDWSRMGFLGHHTHFDALIGSVHAGVRPKAYFCTQSMAQATLPVSVPRGLDSVAKALGLKGKTRAGALTSTKGKRWHEFTAEEKKNLKLYAGDDIDDTWAIFRILSEYMPIDELRLIDETIRMYAQPIVLLDKPILENLLDKVIADKEDLLRKARADAGDLSSDEKFAQLLMGVGIDPPMKWSEKQQKEVYAFAKQDQNFKDLLEHPDDRVVTLVEARLGVKSSSVENRTTRFIKRADYGPQPVYYKYWGAGTGRWSGADKVNWQNLKRGSDLRKAVYAPPGHMLVIADLSQIEARINAWFAGQYDIVDAFASGEDVYRYVASQIYGKPIELITGDERFIGKMCVLALGYGAGWSKFAHILRIGAMGPPVDISDSLARDIHTGWRRNNKYIVANWKGTHNKIVSAFVGKQRLEDKVVAYEGTDTAGFMHMPGGMALRYDDVHSDGGELVYLQKYRVNVKVPPTKLYTRLYGGIEVENRTQALARRVIAEHMLAIKDELGSRWRMALTTHDEIVGVVPIRSAKKALRAVEQIMSQPPSWAPDLPIAVEAHISERYDK